MNHKCDWCGLSGDFNVVGGPVDAETGERKVFCSWACAARSTVDAHDFSKGHIGECVKEMAERAPAKGSRRLWVRITAKGGLQMTLKDAKAKLAFVNVTLRKRDGEYRVNFKDGKEATAYYTDCLEDAVVTGLAMADCASTGDNAGVCQACGKASEVK